MKDILESLSKKQKHSVIVAVSEIILAILLLSVHKISRHSSQQQRLIAPTDYQKALITYNNSSQISGFDNIINLYPNSAYAIFSSWYLADNAIQKSSLAGGIDLANLSTSGKSNYNNAISILEKSIKNNPKNSLTNITKTRLARAYIETNQNNKAIQTIQSTDAYAKNSYTLMLLGDVYIHENDTKKAVEYYTKAKELDTNPALQSLIIKKINNLS